MINYTSYALCGDFQRPDVPLSLYPVIKGCTYPICRNQKTTTNDKSRKEPDPSPDNNADDFSSSDTDAANDPQLKKRKKNADLVSASSATTKSSDTNRFATVQPANRAALPVNKQPQRCDKT